MSSARAPLEVFISYAHADQALKDELLKHLSPLKRRGLVEHWHDRQIDAGAEWAEEIDARLESAHIILLLISPDFLHSDFCYQKEMVRALERHAAIMAAGRSLGSIPLTFPGSSSRELNFRPPKRYCAPLRPGIQSIESRRGSSSHQHNPFFALTGPDANEDHGAVYCFNLVYSGNFLGLAEGECRVMTRDSYNSPMGKNNCRWTASFRFSLEHAIGAELWKTSGASR
jgi:hypothetical protein